MYMFFFFLVVVERIFIASPYVTAVRKKENKC